MELLARIRDLGSLRKAAEALGMSYRAALGQSSRPPRRRPAPAFWTARPATGTAAACPSSVETMLTSYARWLAVVEETALAEARRCFPWPVEPFAGKDGPA